MLLGSVLSGVGAYLSVRFLTRYFAHRSLRPFGSTASSRASPAWCCSRCADGVATVVSLSIHRRTLAAVAIASGATVALLTVLVVERDSYLVRSDVAISRSALDRVNANPALLRAARLVTQFGNPVVIDVACGVAMIVALYYRRWVVALAVLGARLLSLGAEQLLKFTVARPRPHPLHPVAHVAGPGFPSGHSTGIAMFTTLAIIALLTCHLARRSAGSAGQ